MQTVYRFFINFPFRLLSKGENCFVFLEPQSTDTKQLEKGLYVQYYIFFKINFA